MGTRARWLCPEEDRVTAPVSDEGTPTECDLGTLLAGGPAICSNVALRAEPAGGKV